MPSGGDPETFFAPKCRRVGCDRLEFLVNVTVFQIDHLKRPIPADRNLAAAAGQEVQPHSCEAGIKKWAGPGYGTIEVISCKTPCLHGPLPAIIKTWLRALARQAMLSEAQIIITTFANYSRNRI